MRVVAVIPGRCAASNPESRGSGFGPADRPGTTVELGPRQIEDALGDDAEHDLGRAALDRVGLGPQPGARTGALLRPLALPFQRIDAAGRHQDLVTALVELGAVIFHR